MTCALLMQYGEALFGPRFRTDLAEALGVSERTMRRWLAGDTEPPASLVADLEAIARDRIKTLDGLLKAKPPASRRL